MGVSRDCPNFCFLRRYIFRIFRPKLLSEYEYYLSPPMAFHRHRNRWPWTNRSFLKIWLRCAHKGTAPSFLATPPHINSETGKANRTDFKFNRCINRIHPNKNPFTNFGEESVGVSTEWHMGCPIFRHPYYPRKGKSYGLQILYAYLQGRLEQN